MTIAQALSPTGLPCCHPPYIGEAEAYVTYQLLGQGSVLYAESQERETGVSYAVDLYCNEPYVQTMLQVKKALEEAGYIATIGLEYYEPEVDRYHIYISAEKEGALYG